MARKPDLRIEPPVPAGALISPPPDAPTEPLAAPAPSDPLVITIPPWRRIAQWILIAIALYAVIWLFSNAIAGMTPFIIGLVLAYLLLPLVNRLSRRMPRPAAILTVYVGAFLLLFIAVAYIVPPVINQLQQLLNSLPTREQLESFGSGLLQQYQDRVPAEIKQPIEQGLNSALRTLQSNFASYIQGLSTFLFNQVLQLLNTVSFLIGFLIIPFWLFYVLNDQAKGSAFLNRILHPRLRADFWNVWGLINQVFSDYIRGQLLLGVAVGLMVGIGLVILRFIGFDVPYALLLAIVAGITELVPIIGPILGAIPGVLLGFFASEHGWQTGLAVLALYLVVQQLENNFLVPRIIGESIGLHEAILTVVLIAMGQIFGLLGVVLAAPVAAIGRDLFVYIYRRLGGMSAEDTARSIHAEGRAEEQQAHAKHMT
ncbi:MAG TPA: AI-2E family transporter [Kouleothrix sp.]|nr:AI-2E family transporter [Kouleothrix sp.]